MLISRFTAFVVLLFLFSMPALADESYYSRVINIAGKQRMLTQKMSKEALLVSMDIDKDANLANLKTSRDLFEKTLRGLRDGDDALGLLQTTDPALLSVLDKVNTLWMGFDPVVSGIINAGTADAAQIGRIAAHNEALLDAVDYKVGKYEAASVAAKVDPSLALAINIAGRQRMFTQKMSKEFLLVFKNYEADENREKLRQTVALFDKKLHALTHGDQSLGLKPVSGDEILTQLRRVELLWLDFKPRLEMEPTPESVRIVAAENLSLLVEMDKAVYMFEALGHS